MKKNNILAIAILAAAITAGIIFVKNRESGANHAATRTIAVANLQKHPILDAVEKGVVDELKREGYVEGTTARYVFRNAGGDMQQVSAIAAELGEPHATAALARRWLPL
jgi:ABC-type uncharacterized transport system substrate-binding protein